MYLFTLLLDLRDWIYQLLCRSFVTKPSGAATDRGTGLIRFIEPQRFYFCNTHLFFERWSRRSPKVRFFKLFLFIYFFTFTDKNYPHYKRRISRFDLKKNVRFSGASPGALLSGSIRWGLVEDMRWPTERKLSSLKFLRMFLPVVVFAGKSSGASAELDAGRAKNLIEPSLSLRSVTVG